MSTQVETVKGPPPASKYDRLVQKQLEQTSSRLRRLDLLKMTLVLAVAVMAYAVLMLALDRWLELPSLVRLGLFALFAVGTLAYLGWQLRSLFLLRVNPY